MNNNTYADGVANVTLIDGVVRMDLVNILKVEGDKTNLAQVGTVSMSIQGFLRTYEQLGQVINRMVEQGVLKKNESLPAEPQPGQIN